MTPPRLENRLPPEGLLERDDNPLRELAWLLGGSVALLVVLVLVTGLSARWLAPKLPFKYEVALADRVAAVMALPPGMRVVVGDDASEPINAYATVGGRIRVFHGLLRKLDSEEALAALLAHEIAHVKHRHVAANMGHGLAVALVLSVVMPEFGAQSAQGLLGGTAQLTLLGYSRDAERQADAEALAASLALYGHAQGLATLFKVLPGTDAPAGSAWLRSHPDTTERQAALQAAATARGASMTGSVTPLPAALRSLPPPTRGER